MTSSTSVPKAFIKRSSVFDFTHGTLTIHGDGWDRKKNCAELLLREDMCHWDEDEGKNLIVASLPASEVRELRNFLIKTIRSYDTVKEVEKVIDYWLGERSQLHPMFGGQLTFMDICYNVFIYALNQRAKDDPEAGVGWFNDTNPLAKKAIENLRQQINPVLANLAAEMASIRQEHKDMESRYEDLSIAYHTMNEERDKWQSRCGELELLLSTAGVPMDGPGIAQPLAPDGNTESSGTTESDGSVTSTSSSSDAFSSDSTSGSAETSNSMSPSASSESAGSDDDIPF